MDFRTQVEKGLGCAVILAGSDSDKVHIEKLAESLRKYSVPFEVRIASAHKQSVDLANIIHEYDRFRGPLTYIAVAGGTDALSGTTSWQSYRPTISCPPDAPNQTCLNNPPGSSNATIFNPSNAARFIAQIYSSFNPVYRNLIEKENGSKVAKLKAADETFRKEITPEVGK